MDAVIILNWNKAGLTRDCVRVAQQSTRTRMQWIVVDNGSEPPLDGLPEGTVLIRNPKNLGFAGGANTGMRYAFSHGAEFAILLNNDAEPLPDALDALLGACKADPNIGLASPVILNSDLDGKIDWCGGRWTSFGYESTSDPEEGMRWHAERPDRIWLVGTALLVSRRLVERIGYLDEKLFAYWEDNDISRRSAAEGFRNVVVPDAHVRHHGGSFQGQIRDRPPYYFYYMARNELLLARKMGELRNLRATYWALHRFRLLHTRLASQKSCQRALGKGVLHGLLGIGGQYAAPGGWPKPSRPTR